MEPNALPAAPRRRLGSTSGALLASALTFGMGLVVGAPAVAQTNTTINTGDGATSTTQMGPWGGLGFTQTYGQTFRAPSSGSSPPHSRSRSYTIHTLFCAAK